MRGRYQGGQRGSLAGFIIVGVLLALVLVGGLYGLNRYNAQRSDSETAAKDESSDSKSDDTSSERKTAATGMQKTTTDSDTSDDRSRTNDDDASKPADDDSSTDTAASATHLPQTGPESGLLGLLAVTALAFAVTHYARSRRA